MPKRSSAPKKTTKTARKASAEAKSYEHSTADAALRPDVGVQKQFKGKKPPKQYRYDSSLSPSLEWDENPAREQGEALIAGILASKDLEEAKAKAEQLKAMSKPFLNWAGKVERQAFDVPTLPLFVHERLSTQAILETVKVHAKDKQTSLDLFGDPQRPLHEQLRAYEHRDKWVNRMILGDSLVVMNSLLEYEGLGGQVQMIYMDPPYGVKFGSNFQPFVRKRDVKHGDDDDLTREPEMVQAYRDTWELGEHSYLKYLRDRVLLARHLLTATGSLFVQISDVNLHRVRDLLDEVFGSQSCCGVIAFAKTTGAGSPSGGTDLLPQTTDYLLWYAKDVSQVRFRQLYVAKVVGESGATQYEWIELEGQRRFAKEDELMQLPSGARLFAHDNLTSQTGGPTTTFKVKFEGQVFEPRKGGWKTNADGMERLRSANRLMVIGNSLRYVRYLDDFPAVRVTDGWNHAVHAHSRGEGAAGS